MIYLRHVLANVFLVINIRPNSFYFGLYVFFLISAVKSGNQLSLTVDGQRGVPGLGSSIAQVVNTRDPFYLGSLPGMIKILFRRTFFCLSCILPRLFSLLFLFQLHWKNWSQNYWMLVSFFPSGLTTIMSTVCCFTRTSVVMSDTKSTFYTLLHMSLFSWMQMIQTQ